MQFGQAILTNGRYEFIQHPKDVVDADNSQVIVNSVRVFAEVDTPMAFRFQNANTSFNPTRSSITHQKDRDIAMVIDRSGSMLEFIDTPILDTVLRHLRNNRLISSSELDVSGINSNVRVYTQYYTNNTLTRMLELQDRLDRINQLCGVNANAT
jgi:hypothetical protein